MATFLSLSPPPILPQTPFSPHTHFDFSHFPTLRSPFPATTLYRRHFPATPPRAVREWQEYEAAVKEKDLAKALRFLRDVQVVDKEKEDLSESTRLGSELGVYGWERNWEVLDTCLNADDMRLVAAAYSFLSDKGFLPTFGKYRNIGNTHFSHRLCVYILYVYVYWLVNVYMMLQVIEVYFCSFGGTKRCYTQCNKLLDWFTRCISLILMLIKYLQSIQ